MASLGLLACGVALAVIALCWFQNCAIKRVLADQDSMALKFAESYAAVLSDTKKFAHDRLHFGFAAAVLASEVVKHCEGFSVSVNTHPQLQMLNVMLSDGNLTTPGKIARQRKLFNGVSLDIDDHGGVVGMEVVGQQQEGHESWEDGDGD